MDWWDWESFWRTGLTWLFAFPIGWHMRGWWTRQFPPEPGEPQDEKAKV